VLVSAVNGRPDGLALRHQCPNYTGTSNSRRFHATGNTFTRAAVGNINNRLQKEECGYRLFVNAWVEACCSNSQSFESQIFQIANGIRLRQTINHHHTCKFVSAMHECRVSCPRGGAEWPTPEMPTSRLTGSPLLLCFVFPQQVLLINFGGFD